MKKALLALALAAFAGCISVARLPMPENEEFSDDGVCTNRTWITGMSIIMKEKDAWSCYPTIYARCKATEMVFAPIDYTKKGRELYCEKHKRWAAIPLTILWLTSPLDAVVDTIYLPFDLWL